MRMLATYVCSNRHITSSSPADINVDTNYWSDLNSQESKMTKQVPPRQKQTVKQKELLKTGKGNTESKRNKTVSLANSISESGTINY